MSSYRDMAKEAMEQGTGKQITERQCKLAEGDELVGLFKGRDLIKSKDKKMPDFFRYHFDTDDGPAAYLFSQSFDHTSGAQLREGKVYYVKLNGQRKLSGNRKFNDYTVILINPSADDEEIAADDSDEDIPF